MHANEIGEVLDDPHLNATGLFRKREHPIEGGYCGFKKLTTTTEVPLFVFNSFGL